MLAGTFFDGCNTCVCQSGFKIKGGCTARFCLPDERASPVCLKVCELAPAPAPPGSAPVSFIELLDASVHQQPAAVPVDGAYCFEGSTGPGTAVSGGILVKGAPAIEGAPLSITVTATVPTGRSGYLVARATATGARYFALYVRTRNRGLNFYYRVSGSSVQHRLSFAKVVISDGVSHTVGVVASADNKVTVTLDGNAVETASLQGEVEDCGVVAADCITHVGQRQGGFGLNGCISSVLLGVSAEHDASVASTPPALLPPTPPAPASFDTVNLLDPVLHDNAIRALPGGAFCFAKGDPGLRHTTVFPIGTGPFSVVARFRVGAGAFGYLYAKGGGGSLRHHSLYVQRSDGRLALYYAIGAGAVRRQRKLLVTKRSVAGNVGYQITVGFAGAKVRVVLASTSDRGPPIVLEDRVLELGGAITDCGGASTSQCSLTVGSRVQTGGGGTTLPLAGGCIIEASFRGEAYTTGVFDAP